MRLECHRLLADMLAACERIERYRGGVDAEAVSADEMLRDAVERQLIIVGEALFQISKLEPDWENLVTAARDIVRLRHILVHGYAVVTPYRIGLIVCADVPRLLAELRALPGLDDPAVGDG